MFGYRGFRHGGGRGHGGMEQQGMGPQDMGPGMGQGMGRRGMRRFARGPFGRHGEGPDGGGEGFRGRHGFRGGRGGRFFEHGELRLVVLALIAERPRHGYELIKEIEERLGGAYTPSPGTIYPTLTLLEEIGQVAVEASEGGKKLYSLTADGQVELSSRKAEVEAIFARMAALNGKGTRGGSLQVMRAMHNLRMALRLRAMRGPLAEDELARIVAVLDQAARDIERS